MSLLNLLTVGNSLSTVEDHPSRYRMRRENLLPHFGAEEDAAKGIPISAEYAGGAQTSLPLRELAAAPAALPENASHPARGASEPASSAPEQLPRPAYPHGRWSLGVALARSRPWPAARVAEPVQTELPWEDIPVARNDLSEADLEVVRSTRRPVGATHPPAERPEASRRRPLFRRLTARWFREESR